MEPSFDPARSLVTLLVIAVAAYAYTMAALGRGTSAPSASGQDPLFFVILVPCLNEARVIGRTLETLAALRGRHHILVIDDDSDDDSVDVVRRSPGWLVTVLERHGLDARVGKGAALDQGYRAARDLGADRLYAPSQIIVTVFDADSRVPPDFLERVTPYFADPAVVGVQSAVRMFNARHNWLTSWQNLEFVVWAQIFARAKDRLGSATLGGNGQCVRLSALLSLGADPWRPSLTEDLDLSLRLILHGGRIRFCTDTFVAQEAVTHPGRLVRQRARWVQGHLVAWEHLPAIMRSSAPRHVRLDLLVFLLLPATLVPLALATIDGWLTLLSGLGTWSIEVLVAWYLLAFASVPLTTWAMVRDGEVDRRRAVLQAHLFVAYAMVWMVAAGRAVWSILRGDRAWAKTARAPTPDEPLAPTPTERRGRVPVRTWRAAATALAIVALVGASSLVMIGAAVIAAGTYLEVTG
jgi:cellulose synthase/poly-beta-1,6-N-acetylglucosamine synthase-like glycosyltransferase